MTNPQATKIRKVDHFTIQMWKSFLEFRSLEEAEEVGGDQANQLATLVIKTINDLAQNAKHAGFADTVIRLMAKIHPLLAAIKNSQGDEITGSFKALLEQTLRKYEGKPGDAKRAMLGGILEKTESLSKTPEHIVSYIESLFDWVVLRIVEVKNATQSFYRDPREKYTPLPTLHDLIGPQKENPPKIEPHVSDKGKRTRQLATGRFCNFNHEGKCKWFHHPDVPRKGTLPESDKWKVYQKLRPDKRCRFQLVKKLSSDMRTLVDYELTPKERAGHDSVKNRQRQQKTESSKGSNMFTNSYYRWANHHANPDPY